VLSSSGMSSPWSSRRLLVVAVVVGLFVVLDLALFGWLIIRTLSQRELETILLQTREEAEELAGRIASRAEREGRDLYTAVARERETQTYIDSVLRQRDIVRTVEIRDRDGVLVFRSRTDARVPTPAEPVPPLGSAEVPPQIELRSFDREASFEPYDVTVPIGDLGQLHIGISPGELQRRIVVLRRELIGQATAIGAVTVALLLTAYLAVWWLWRRGRRLEEQALEGERLAYIGTLASGLAHEIRNPLNSLNLNMQMLEEELDGGGEPTSRRLLTLTRGEISRLERLVTDFLSYARPRSLELEEVAPGALLEHAAAVAAGELRARRVELEVEDDSGGALVRVDRGQMGQLLLNLVQNAVAATEGSGRPPRLRLAARRQGSRVVLEVADNGIGIAPEDQGRIFELFFSLRRGGTGLGLAIVERIARAHGGAVEVRSAPGEGTTMRLALPAVAGRREAAAHAPLGAAASSP
jgi:signal transduction histidine kinase